ncbi:hypothetical protein JKY79_03720 [Candidatus Babeliales bacterium]|nr:hypothetical protein [Candidatus Babeliales bacterium]
MNLVERVQSLFVQIATVGPVGNMPFGIIIASLLGLPLVLFLRLMKYVHQDLYLLSFMLMSFLLCAIFEAALLTLSSYEYHRVVLGGVVGLMIAFMYQPFSIGWLVTGFALYHVVRIGTGILMQQWWKLEFHLLPGILGFLCRDIVAGIVTNILFFCLHFFV